MVTLNQPSAGDTDWATEINTNWQSIQDVIGTDMTEGSVLFAGASGVYSQANGNFFWDNTNKRLGIGTSSPGAGLHSQNDSGSHPPGRFQRDASAGSAQMLQVVNLGTAAVGTGAYMAYRMYDAGPTERTMGLIQFDMRDVTAGGSFSRMLVQTRRSGGVQTIYEHDDSAGYEKTWVGGFEQVRRTTTGTRIEPGGVTGNPDADLHIVGTATSILQRLEIDGGGYIIQDFFRDDGTPASNDQITQTRFLARDSALNADEFGREEYWASTVTSGSEEGLWRRFIMNTGTLTEIQRVTGAGMRIEPSGVGGSAAAALDVRGATIFNEDGADYDFRVEGDTDTHLLMVDASADRVGISIAAPTNTLDVGGSALFNALGDDADFRIRGDGMDYMFFCDATATTENIAMLTTAAPSWQSMDRGLFIGDTSAAPTGNPSGGGFLYVSGGALTYRGSSGTTTTVAPAEPHCEACGSDYVHEWENSRWGYLSICMKCLAEELGDRPWIKRRRGGDDS